MFRYIELLEYIYVFQVVFPERRGFQMCKEEAVCFIITSDYSQEKLVILDESICVFDVEQSGLFE